MAVFKVTVEEKIGVVDSAEAVTPYERPEGDWWEGRTELPPMYFDPICDSRFKSNVGIVLYRIGGRSRDELCEWLVWWGKDWEENS